MSFEIDIIGKRQLEDGTFSTEVYVNALGELPEDVAQYKVATPVSPMRLYAGIAPEDTHFIVLPNLDVALALANKYNIVVAGDSDEEANA